MLLAAAALMLALVGAQPVLFNCRAAHGNADLCHRAAYQGCVWDQPTSQCTKIQFCGDHITQGACVLDWRCRWWSGQCSPVVPGDFTTIGADALCATINNDVSTTLNERRQRCAVQDRCDWDHVSLQCKTDRNSYAMSPSVTESRCLQDGTAVWRQPEHGCYDPLHPGLHNDLAHREHSICPHGVCHPRGRCNPNVICDAADASSCNVHVGNCHWDTAIGRCKAESSTQTAKDFTRLCADAVWYHAHVMDLRMADIGPRQCPPAVPGTGLSNCTIKSDCERKPVCRYSASENSCKPDPRAFCGQEQCPYGCIHKQQKCTWSAHEERCTMRPDDGSPDESDIPTTGTSSSSSSTGSPGPDDGSDQFTDPAPLLAFFKWRFHWRTATVTGLVTMPLEWSCAAPRTPYLAIRSVAANQSWNCTTISGLPHFPTYLPCGDAKRAEGIRQLALSRNLQAPNQTAYVPLNVHGIARSAIVWSGDQPSDTLLVYDVHVDIFKHSLEPTCNGAAAPLVDKTRQTAGIGSYVDFLVPFSATWLSKDGQPTVSNFDLHTLLYAHRDSLQYIAPVAAAAAANPTRSPLLSTRFSFAQVGFASNATTNCSRRSEQAIQVIYLLEVTDVLQGTTSGPRFLDDIAIVSPCHDFHVVRLVPVGCFNGSCAYYIVARTQCRSTMQQTHNSTWSKCHADGSGNATLVLDSTILLQVWTCIGNLPTQVFGSHFDGDLSTCSISGVRYAHSSVAISDNAVWTDSPRRFDISMSLLRSPTSTLQDILQGPVESATTGAASLPLPMKAVLTETALTVAVYLDNLVLRSTLDLSIVVDTIAIVGVDAEGYDIVPKLTFGQVIATLSMVPKTLTTSPSAYLLPACDSFPGCDGFVASTRMLQAILPAAVSYRVELSVQLNNGHNASSDATPTPAARRLLQDADDDGDIDTVTEVDTEITVGNVTIDEEIITDGDITIIDIEITNGTSVVFAEIIIDTSALDARDTLARRNTTIMIVFFVLLGLLLVLSFVCVGYFWFGQAQPSATAAPFAVTGNKPQPQEQHSLLQSSAVAGRANLRNMPPRVIISGRNGYQTVPTNDY